MAKSEYEINMNYQNAINQANSLHDSANQLRNNAAKQLDDTINQISNAWKGENATAYLNKAQQLVTKINNTASEMDQAANAIKSIADNIRTADLHALELARQREYNNMIAGGGYGGGGGRSF